MKLYSLNVAGRTLIILAAIFTFNLSARADFFSTNSPLVKAREGQTATLLPNGKVLVAGGFNDGFLAEAELYDPASPATLPRP